MNHKAYSLALTTLALLCMPVPFFSFRPTVAPLSLWLFMLAKIGLETFPSWSNDGFASVMGLIICATIAVQILIWGVIILVICRRLIRWTSNIQRSMTKRMVRVSLLCLPVALSAAPLFQTEEEAPQSPWQALWGEFRRKMDWDNYSGAMAGLPSSARELAMQGRYVEAEPLYRRILELGRKHERIQTGAEKYSTAEQLECLAWILHAQGRHTESESTLGEAVAIMKRQWVGSDRNSLRYYQDYLVKLAELLSLHGKHDQAEGILREILEENKKHAIENNQHWARENRSQPLGPIDAEVVRALDHLAEELWRQGNYAGAEALSRESLTMLAALEAADEKPKRPPVGYAGRVMERVRGIPQKAGQIRQGTAPRRACPRVSGEMGAGRTSRSCRLARYSGRHSRRTWKHQ